MITTFCGHGDIIYDDIVYKTLCDEIEKQIKNGCSEFYLGGYGRFDIMAANILKKLKGTYDIKSFLILAYLNKKYDASLYDGTIYPPLEYVPKKFAIIKRNEWMVNNSDIVIAYVGHSWGGAAKTLDYAIKRKKHIINIAEIF